MAEDAFFELWVGLAGQMPARQYSDEVLELATGYPWPRPDGSFVLAEGEGQGLWPWRGAQPGLTSGQALQRRRPPQAAQPFGQARPGRHCVVALLERVGTRTAQRAWH